VLALLYDVHGNHLALEAVLADARAAGAAAWLLGGDYALFGPDPESTLLALEALEGATWIRGNGERWSAHPADAPDDPVVQGAIVACRLALGADRVDALGELPFEATLGGTRFVHASPVSDVRSFRPEPAEDEAELLEGVTAPRLIFGHTHLPFARTAASGVELANPGSVGMPFDGDPRAAYALVHDDGRLEHRRVAYDHRASAAALRARWPGQVWAETVARRIERAQQAV
jgi:diadenosine tetraphosphatase ApaH/serine/threonine PP2A family protein phosphatase